MTAATKDRNTQELAGRGRAFPAAAGAKVWAGTIAVLNAGGKCTNGITAADLLCVGMFTRSYDNSGGYDGSMMFEVDRGTFGPFGNAALAEKVTILDIEKPCYIVDDQTVARTDGAGTRSVAGIVHQVDFEGVWIRF